MEILRTAAASDFLVQLNVGRKAGKCEGCQEENILSLIHISCSLLTPKRFFLCNGGKKILLLACDLNMIREA